MTERIIYSKSSEQVNGHIQPVHTIGKFVESIWRKLIEQASEGQSEVWLPTDDGNFLHACMGTNRRFLYLTKYPNQICDSYDYVEGAIGNHFVFELRRGGYIGIESYQTDKMRLRGQYNGHPTGSHFREISSVTDPVAVERGLKSGFPLEELTRLINSVMI